jgi:hypothetical protein
MAAASQSAVPAKGIAALEAQMSAIQDPDEFIKFLQAQKV